MPGDLREIAGGEFWSALKAAMGEDGLLTYRYLGRKAAIMHGVEFDSMLVRRDMRNETGGLLAAPLAIASAEAGGFTDFNAVPAPVTANLSILDPGHDVVELRIDREVVHAGRNIGFTRSIIRDAADPNRVLALSRGTGIKLGDAPADGVGTYFDLGKQIEDAADLPPLIEVFGGYQRNARWSLPPLAPSQRSTSGSLHLGPIHVVLEAAASDAVQQLAPQPAQVEEWEVMFTARGLVGPFVTRVDEINRRNDRIAVCVSLCDEEKDGRIIAAASAMFRTT